MAWLLVVGSDLRRRYKCPSITIRISNERFGAKIILFWLLNDPVASLTGFFDRGGGVSHLEMRIHPKPQLLSAPARFFPPPSTVPEEDADVVRFQHHEPVAPRFEVKTNEIAIERNRSSEVRNLQQDVIDLWRGGRLRLGLLPENSDGCKRDGDFLWVEGQRSRDFRMTDS